MDAEGREVEVIKSATNLLPKIEFIAVDLSCEKGTKQESTALPVINFLFENGFILYAIAK